MNDFRSLPTLYLLMIASLAVDDHKLKLDSFTREILVDIITQRELQWFHEATSSDIFNSLKYDGFVPISQYTDSQLLDSIIDCDYLLQEVQRQQFNKSFLSHIASVDLLKFIDQYHSEAISFIKDHLQPADLELLQTLAQS